MRSPTRHSTSVRSPSELELVVLGCGTSTGVPLLFCSCKVCRSRDPKNKRTRASVWIRTRGKSFLIDTSIDLRQQALRERIPRLDAILYTHPHSDHVGGADEIRAFNYIQKQRIPAYGNEWTVTELTRRFPYIFAPSGKAEGGGIPQIDLHRIDSHAEFEAAGVKILPVPLRHGSQECVAYRFGSVAYATDCSYIPDSSLEKLRDLELLVLDCLRLTPHGTHFHLEKSLEVIAELRPRRTVLTHLGHDFDYAEWTKRGPKAKLPKGVTLAFDGLKLKV